MSPLTVPFESVTVRSLETVGPLTATIMELKKGVVRTVGARQSLMIINLKVKESSYVGS